MGRRNIVDRTELAEATTLSLRHYGSGSEHQSQKVTTLAIVAPVELLYRPSRKVETGYNPEKKAQMTDLECPFGVRSRSHHLFVSRGPGQHSPFGPSLTQISTNLVTS
ncbi:hypothetical protein SAMD00023353_3600760 [Rosellinia necatrix]|uniref:Uncharacterized protein n=1 Tax=Rosellinia necatrix TaxID=77044 RepID=A0A1S8AA16_ROSNE|nr:hypothetical protein SAMD00023353_3600760 [Rosellinia necatrix]